MKRAKKMDKVKLSIPMEMCMKGFGKMIYAMEKGQLPMQIRPRMKGCGRMMK